MEHSFNIAIAKEHGILEAIIIRHFQFWISKNKASQINQFDGRTWTYGTVENYADIFIYRTDRQINYAIDKLVKKGVLLKGFYSENKFNRKLYYAFKDEKKWLDPILQKRKIRSNKNVKSSIYKEDTKQYIISKYLYDKLLMINPNHKQPDLQKWAKHVDDMIQLDKRKPEEILSMINWIMQHKGSNGFTWKSVILSTKSLRDKYDQLAISRKELETNPGNGLVKRGELNQDKFDRLRSNPPK